MLRYKLYLNDILKAISQIEKSLNFKTRKYFEKDLDSAEATAMRLHVIGESIAKLPEDIKKKYNSIKWDNFVKFRNILSHAYFRVDKDMLWDAVKIELPKLKKVMEKMKNE